MRSKSLARPTRRDSILVDADGRLAETPRSQSRDLPAIPGIRTAFPDSSNLLRPPDSLQDLLLPLRTCELSGLDGGYVDPSNLPLRWRVDPRARLLPWNAWKMVRS